MHVRLSMELPQESFSALRTKPEDFVKEMRLSAAVKWYEIGKISQSKAAEIAGISRQKFLEALKDYRVSPFQISKKELTKETENEE